MNKLTGVYKITNKLTNETYIGKSKNVRVRWREHARSAARLDYALYSDIRHYGIDNFTFEVIEECSEFVLDRQEKYWIKFYLERGDRLYNIREVPFKEKKYAKVQAGRRNLRSQRK